MLIKESTPDKTRVSLLIEKSVPLNTQFAFIKIFKSKKKKKMSALVHIFPYCLHSELLCIFSLIVYYLSINPNFII